MNDISVSVSGGSGIPDHGVDRSAPNSTTRRHLIQVQNLNAHHTARRQRMVIDTLRSRGGPISTSTSSRPAAGSSMAMAMGQQVRGNNIYIGQHNNIISIMAPRPPFPLSMMSPTRPMLPPLEPKPMLNQACVDNNDVNNSTSTVEIKDEEDDEKTNVIKADLKKFECAICFGMLHYWFIQYYAVFKLSTGLVSQTIIFSVSKYEKN